ncbi:dethiobiotin synthase [Isosphaeraceae bacterium EP7]
MSLPGLLVTGTDTDVGKTFVASAILRSLGLSGIAAGALKPLATGAVIDRKDGIPEDARFLMDALGPRPGVELSHVVPILLDEPLAPPVAARRAGWRLTRQLIFDRTDAAVAAWTTRSEVLIVEGIGGLLCPIAEDATLADLASHLDYPLIIVGRLGLGTLNHTILTVEAARLRGLRIAGVVLTQPTSGDLGVAGETNPLELVRWLRDVPLLGVVPHQANAQSVPASLAAIEWIDLARPSRRAGA